MDQTEYKRCETTKVMCVVKHTERQESRHTVKVEELILSQLESTITFFAMKRRRHPKDLKMSPKKDVMTRTNSRSRRSRTGQGRSTGSWNPEFFCSDSDSAVVSDGVDKPLTSPASVVIDLTGKCGTETKGLANVNPAQSSEEVVLLLAGEEDRVHQSELETSRRSSPASIPIRKISLPLGSKAEDTLEIQKLISYNPFRSHTESHECFDSQPDDTISEDSVISGPSSPHAAPISVRCPECDKLFTKMRRQGPPRTKKRDKDPASLSCDQWLLKKTWRPQRRRQVKGKLWVHLKRIRKLAVKRSAAEMPNVWPQCSRPHVFLQRNLHRCRILSSMLGGPPESKTKSQHRRQRATNAWPPLHQRRKKRKSTEKANTSQNLSALDLTIVTNAMEDKLLAIDDSHHTGSQQQEKVRKKQTVSDLSGFQDKKAGCDSVEGTRRVLKFDDSLSTLAMEHKRAGRKLHEGKTDFALKDLDHSGAVKVLSEDLEEFRTPPDLSSVEPKIVRKCHPSLFSSGHSPHGTQKGSFRSMLAVFEKSHNQIIKESHN